MKRGFEADGPNMAWFADTAYVKTRQGWLYLALATGVWSRRIVGWPMGRTSPPSLLVPGTGLHVRPKRLPQPQDLLCRLPGDSDSIPTAGAESESS